MVRYGIEGELSLLVHKLLVLDQTRLTTLDHYPSARYVVSSAHTPKVTFQVPESSFSLPISSSSSGSLDEPGTAISLINIKLLIG